MSGSKARPKRIVAVDWDARTLRVVHALLGKREVKIDKLLAVAIPREVDLSDPQQLGRHLRRTLDQAGLTTKDAVADVPRDQAILKTLTLPTAQPEELPPMVQIQISKELPFPVTEAVIDFAVAPTDSGAAPGEVSVAAIRREELARYEAIFAAAGLKLDRIGLRPLANKAAVGKQLEPAMPERVLFIDVRPTFMEIDVLRHGALSFSRSASVTIPEGDGAPPVLSITAPAETNRAGARVDEAAEAPERLSPERVLHTLVLEVKRSIEAYRAGDPGAAIDHVVIGGDVGVEEALAEAIHKRLNITTELYNPASTFGWEPDEGAAASAFAASLGLVLGHAEDASLHFDFLHPKEAVSAAQRRLRKAPMAAAVVILFAAAAAMGLAQYTKPSRQKLTRLEASIEELQAHSEEDRKFLALVAMVDEFDARQHVWVDLLYDVFALLPSNREIVLNYVEMNQKSGQITLKTKTKKRDTPTTIVRALRKFQSKERPGLRFDASVGPQEEKKGEKYPYFQDLRILVRHDKTTAGARTGSASRG